MGRGLCAGHYSQQYRGRPLSAIVRGRTESQRFWQKVDKSGDCWLWTGARGGHGYGNFGGTDGKTWRAHTWAYVAAVGSVPTGLHLDHLCRNRLCVNPDHLEPVTSAENTRRGIAPMLARYRNIDQVECKHGHPFSGQNLYIQPKTGYRYCRTCQARRRREYLARKSVDPIHILVD